MERHNVIMFFDLWKYKMCERFLILFCMDIPFLEENLFIAQK